MEILTTTSGKWKDRTRTKESNEQDANGKETETK